MLCSGAAWRDMPGRFSMDKTWFPSESEFKRMTMVPELTVKEPICRLLGEHSVPSDWGGEESDVLSANLVVEGRRHVGHSYSRGGEVSSNEAHGSRQER